MQPSLKKILRAVSLDIRHALEGSYDNTGAFHPGDLETRMNALGVWRERPAKALDELSHLSVEDKAARQVIDAYIAYRAEAEISRADAVAEFVRESAYNWANRLLALRCMEARSIIDEVILQKEIYGGRSLVHNRLARRNPAACAGPDEGLFAVLFQEFEARAKELPELFAPTSPAIALRPSLPALKRCLALLSGIEKPSGQEAATDEVFSASDALGWAYQYWNTEEKDRVFEKVRTQKGAKIEGADIIPATQLYTEPYMVKFLVQNSLGATWMNMHPDSKLSEGWEYYVKDADRAPQKPKALEAITQLDPACGSGHFHLEGFDLFFQMYREEHRDWSEAQIAASILNNNLYGIDIDERAVQIAAAALWMKAREYAPDLPPEALTSFHHHLVATNIRLPKGKDHLKAFLTKHPEASPLQPALEAIFEGLANVHELGSLVQIEEPVEKELHYLREKYEMAKKHEVQGTLFEPTVIQGELPLGVESYEQWKSNTLEQLEVHFTEEAEAAEAVQAFFGQSARKGLDLFETLSRRYNIVTANPPYMGSKNMGPMLKNYIERYYKSGKRDLFAALIEQSRRMLLPNGECGIITPNSWLSQKSFAELRFSLLKEDQLQLVVQLGRHAFSEADPPGFPSLFVFSRLPQTRFDFFMGCEHPISMDADKQATELQYRIKNKQFSKIKQSDIEKIHDRPIIISLPNDLIRLLGSSQTVEEIASTPKGLTTANNERFLRFFWEITDLTRWFPYAKGGAFCKWYGLIWNVVDYQNDGIRLKASETAVIRNERFYKNKGLTYTEVARGAFGVRILDEGTFFDARSPGIFSATIPLYGLMAFLNSRIECLFFRQLSPGILLDQAYIPKLPIPDKVVLESLDHIGAWTTNLKSKIALTEIIEYNYKDDDRAQSRGLRMYAVGQILRPTIVFICASEAMIDDVVVQSYKLSSETIDFLYSRTGKPAGCFDKIRGYEKIDNILNEHIILPINLKENIDGVYCQDLSPLKLLQLKNSLRSLFERGSKAKDDMENGDNSFWEMEKDIVNVHLPLPAETFLEELSQKLHIHPISVYWLLKEGIEQEGWRCLSEEKRLTEDRFTVLILHLFGHRWPKQIETGEPVPEWADKDGIIPLTPGLPEAILLERVRSRLPEVFPGGTVALLEREFEEIMSESLEKWLSSSFFKHHISQFKKRPIVWQLSSRTTNSTGGKGKKKGLDKAPAFACLVYYHKLDHNSLTTLQSQYARPLRQSYETELRTLDNTAFLTPDQSSRRIQLEAWIDELKDFETRLEQCAHEGFTTRSGSSISPALAPMAAKEPLDRWTSRDGQSAHPANRAEFESQEMRYDPDINDGVRVNIAPLQKFGLLAADVLDAKDIEKAIADRAEWRADERRWCRDGKLPQPGWWK